MRQSPIKIQGSKYKIVEWLVANFPTDSLTHVEPFVGSGVVAANTPIQSKLLADNNPAIVDFLNYCMMFHPDKSKDLLSRLKKWARQYEKGGKEFYYKLRDEYNETRDPEVFLFLNHICFNGLIRFNSKGKFNVPWGHQTGVNEDRIIAPSNDAMNDWVSRILQYREAFAGAVIDCVDYRDVLKHVKDDPDVFVYCDPPYAGRESTYANPWDISNERELSEILRTIKGKFAVSTWIKAGSMENPLIKEHWNGLNIRETTHWYSIGPKKNNRPSVIEGLITNY